jgi:menaquinone-dependent protoporphyrinogen oxidase
MKILVAVASRHGATREIAEEIGKIVESKLVDEGHTPEIDVLFTDTVTTLDGYDGVILGSAVYIGHWLDSAQKFADTHVEFLRRVPVWLFSSGPVGERLKPGEDPVDIGDLTEALGARGHRLFGGNKIDRSAMRFAERAVVTALRVQDGDYRGWPSNRSWAREVASSMHKTHSEA